MEMNTQHVHISVQLLDSLFHFIIASVSALINGQGCSDTNDGLFERMVVSVYNEYLHILCMIEPGKDIRFSSSVKNQHNMHLSRRLHRSTSDGLLMVAQRKGALNIHCILARFMYI